MNNKKWQMSKVALRAGYIILAVAVLGGTGELFLTKGFTIEWWRLLIQTAGLFIFGILTQFGVVNHMDKRLHLGGNNAKVSEEKLDNNSSNSGGTAGGPNNSVSSTEGN